MSKVIPFLLLCACSYPAGPLDITAVTATEGLVADIDGSFYFSQSRSIGRFKLNGTPEKGYIPIKDANEVWGLARSGPRLFAGSPTTKTIYLVDLLGSPPVATTYLANAGTPNGLTIGPDSLLYYSDFDAKAVYRVRDDGQREKLNAKAIERPNGLAFDGAVLHVLSFGDGTLHRFIDDAGNTEVVASHLGSPDGLAFDGMGHAYVSDYSGGRLLRVSLDTGDAEVVRDRLNAPANIVLLPNDIFVASAGALVRVAR